MQFFAKLHSPRSTEKNSEDIKTERPSSFLCQTAEARGLHSLSALFSAKVHISQKKNQRRPSQDFTSRRTWIKSTTTRPLKLNHEMLGGLSMGNPTSPHRPYYREVDLGNKAHSPIAKKNTEQSNMQDQNSNSDYTRKGARSIA